MEYWLGFNVTLDSCTVRARESMPPRIGICMKWLSSPRNRLQLTRSTEQLACSNN